ncbi:MAG: M15 family metallopeptidase [Reichenbachiella sp.]
MKQIIVIALFISSCSLAQTVKEEVVVENIISQKIQSGIALNSSIVLGKVDYKSDTNFVKLSGLHTSKDIYLHQDTYTAFEKMYEKAKSKGVELTVISGTRDFYHQKSIWDRKWNKYSDLEPYKRAKKILEFSSMPGTSRHHWGTDLDINNLNDAYFLSGRGKVEYDWLVQNANEYGFYQVYTTKDQGRTGYNEEKWHWSYMPLASQYLAYYNDHVSYDDIVGFKGAALADSCQMISDYVNGIAIAAKQFKK